MGLGDIFRLGGNRVRAVTSVGITETGKREAQKYSSGGADFAILAALDDKSPQSMRALASETEMPTGEVMQRVKSLDKRGYVRIIGD